MTRPAPTRERELTANKGSCPLQSENPAEAGTENAIRKAFCARTVCCAAHIPKEALMRIPALAILTIATVLTATSARAQTYSPAYPVCLHAFGEKAGYIECGYTSLAQCDQSASGRAAQCIINPYFASAHVPAGRHYRQHRRVY
jgi:hypothetical protein